MLVVCVLSVSSVFCTIASQKTLKYLVNNCLKFTLKLSFSSTFCIDDQLNCIMMLRVSIDCFQIAIMK